MFFCSEVIFRNTISTLFVRQIIVFLVQWNLNLRGNHLTNVRRIRKYLSSEATQTLVHALIIGRIDYCNSILYGLPSVRTAKLQGLQNSAARLIFIRFSQITPLAWLPVKF